MSKNTDLIVKLIDAKASIQDSNPLGRFGLEVSPDWTDSDITIALYVLQDLIHVAELKKLELEKIQDNRNKNAENFKRVKRKAAP